MKHCETCACDLVLRNPGSSISAAYHRNGPLTEKLAALKAETETDRVRLVIVDAVAFMDDHGLTAKEAWKSLFPERKESNGIRPRFTELQGWITRKGRRHFDPTMRWIVPKPKLDKNGEPLYRNGKPVHETREGNTVYVLSPLALKQYDYTRLVP